MVDNVKNLFVYASSNNNIAGNNRAGVVKSIFMQLALLKINTQSYILLVIHIINMAKQFFSIIKQIRPYIENQNHKFLNTNLISVD